MSSTYLYLLIFCVATLETGKGTMFVNYLIVYVFICLLLQRIVGELQVLMGPYVFNFQNMSRFTIKVFPR